MTNDDDEFVDSDIERSVVTSGSKAKGKTTIYPKKRKSKGVMIKKPVPKSTSKRRRSERPNTKGPGPIFKSAGPQELLGFCQKNWSLRKSFYFKRKGEDFIKRSKTGDP